MYYTDNGRSCEQHPDGCGLSVSVGEILRLNCIETQFQEEHIIVTKKQEYNSMKNDALKEALKDAGVVTGLSNKDKNWLVSKLLEIRNEPNDDSVLTEVKIWTEWAVEAYKVDGWCKIGFIARNYLSMYPENILNGSFVKVLRIRANSEFLAEKNESLMRGGICLVETVTRVETFE